MGMSAHFPRGKPGCNRAGRQGSARWVSCHLCLGPHFVFQSHCSVPGPIPLCLNQAYCVPVSPAHCVSPTVYQAHCVPVPVSLVHCVPGPIPLCTRPIVSKLYNVAGPLCPSTIAFEAHCVQVLQCSRAIVSQYGVPGPLCPSPIVYQAHCVPVLQCTWPLVPKSYSAPGPLCPSPTVPQAHCVPVLQCPSPMVLQACYVPVLRLHSDLGTQWAWPHWDSPARLS